MAKTTPIVVALTPTQAVNTLASRLGKIADPIRQIATRLGARPYRVFLVWTKWSGVHRGEGTETEYGRVEVLPTPVVTSMDAIALNPNNIGLVQIGDVRLTEVSTSFSEDTLMGRTNGDLQVEQPYSFFYEIVADGRAGDNPVRTKFRVKGRPHLQADNAQWVLNLERVGDDRRRDGTSQGEPR